MALAQSLLLNGELEAAVSTASLAVEGGGSLRSARFQRYVTVFRTEVSAHAMTPTVVAFNDQVKTLSPAWRTTSSGYQGRQSRGPSSFRSPAMRRRYAAAVRSSLFILKSQAK
ncbi:hypothetical protein [Streptomyces sp. NPDC050564]|uniref:hypothetical protein n=1 Tax=Streptomyces sp. NPDC050564 TaxID=3365631 RepID=UPI0037A2ED17